MTENCSATTRNVLLAGKCCNLKNKKFEKFNFSDVNTDKVHDNPVMIYTSVHYYLVQYEKHCLLKYVDYQIDNDKVLTKNFDFKNQIKQIQLNNEFFLVLESNGDIYKYDFKDEMLKKLNFLNVETQSQTKPAEHITQVATGETINVATTNANSVYNIPNKIFEMRKHEKIKKVCCGMEHGIFLTTNGDVYTCGIGLRGQLGHGEICNEDKPTLVEALAGVKILDIAAGGWMSAAVSVFGDLYVWGWNSNGQLGLRVNDANPAVYALPQIVEFPCDEFSVESVACGNRHSLLRTSDNKYLVTGSNKYGQLGVTGLENMTWKQGYDKEDVYIDQFTEISDVQGDFIVSCGYWSSLLFER